MREAIERERAILHADKVDERTINRLCAEGMDAILEYQAKRLEAEADINQRRMDMIISELCDEVRV